MLKLLKPRWRKVVRDLWLNKSRTVVVVLSIAVGVFAVGTIASSQIILSRDLSATYQATNPANATILTFQGFGDDVVDAVKNIREIEEAEARQRVSLRVETGPDQWQILWVSAIPDFDDIKIDQFGPEAGQWPPGDRELLIERSALPLLGVEMGDVLTIKTPDGKIKQMPITGLAHDLNAQMYTFDGVASGFITTDTLEWLGQANEYNELRIIVAENKGDIEHIQAVTDKARDKLERAGRTIWFSFVPQPGKHLFLDPIIQAISIMMGALALLSLLLSGFLVINTISALIAQQTRQIGMMKAVGARTRQVIAMYLVTVGMYGLLALLIAIPLGVFGAYQFSGFIASYLNFDVTNYRLPTEVLLAQIAVGLVVPLIAGLYPIFMGTRITVREATSEYGLGRGKFGGNFIDRSLLLIQQSRLLRRYLTRPTMLSLRNTFRRKARLALTLLTLILGGAIFITVFSLRMSLLSTMAGWLDYFQYDVAAQFGRSYRVEQIIRETKSVPGVVEAETWGFYNVRRERPDGTSSDNLILFAPPADTKLVNPTIIDGRWLKPGDTNAVVVNTIVLRDESDIGVGDEIMLKIHGRERPWRVVGIATGGMPMGTMFANYPYFSRINNDLGRAEWVFATINEEGLEAQTRTVRQMENRYERAGMDVNATVKVTEEMTEAEAMFEVIIVLLLIMAFLLAAIGGLGLMGTMSINVLERTREIGVIRAIGASNWSVLKIFITEGVLIGVISWAVGTLLAYPFSRLLGNAIGDVFLNSPLEHNFSLAGVLFWLALVVLLSALASALPAWNAARITVREVLAYE
jgi:putative ABC transport system permease protein